MLFEWLQDWYISVSNNKINKNKRISINTLDNPGWMIHADLLNTKYEHNDFEVTLIERSKNDWIAYKIIDNVFMIYAGPQNLEEIISIFKDFIINKKVRMQDISCIRNDIFVTWLEDWYFFNCDGDWEHGYSIDIHTQENMNWYVKINLCNMMFSLEGLPLQVVSDTPNDILNYKIDDEYFIGNASPNNLVKLLNIFRNMVEKNEDKGYHKEFYEMKEFTRAQTEYYESIGIE